MSELLQVGSSWGAEEVELLKWANLDIPLQEEVMEASKLQRHHSQYCGTTSKVWDARGE